MHVKRITSLYDKIGKIKDVIPIEKYPDIRKPSGVYTYVYKKTKWNSPIKERKLKKTNTNLLLKVNASASAGEHLKNPYESFVDEMVNR